LEKNPILLAIASIVVAIGGIVQIVPLFYLQSTIEKVDGMRPYTPRARRPQHLRARGLLPCHSQMIARCATRSSATATTRWRPRACTTIRSVGFEAQRADLARVGLKLHRTRADRAPEGSALGRAAVDHADLRVPASTPLDKRELAST